jgi:hypothetical protein
MALGFNVYINFFFLDSFRLLNTIYYHFLNYNIISIFSTAWKVFQ